VKYSPHNELTYAYEQMTLAPLEEDGHPTEEINSEGYRMMRVKSRLVYSDYIAWCLQTGNWPMTNIIHINGNRADNRWVNLRLADPSEDIPSRLHDLYSSYTTEQGDLVVELTTDAKEGFCSECGEPEDPSIVN
jgi:hypothetical protein